MKRMRRPLRDMQGAVVGDALPLPHAGMVVIALSVLDALACDRAHGEERGGGGQQELRRHVLWNRRTGRRIVLWLPVA